MPEAVLQRRDFSNREQQSPKTTPRLSCMAQRNKQARCDGVACSVVAASDLADIRWGLQWPAAEPGFQPGPLASQKSTDLQAKH